jgi:hypothetical protein
VSSPRPPPYWPPGRDLPGPVVEPGTSPVVWVLLAAVLFAAGLGASYLIFEASDEETPEAATEPDDEAPAVDEEESEAEDDEPEAEPPAVPTLGEVQATLTFVEGATPGQIERIEQAWRDSPLLSGVLFSTAEEIEDVMGFGADSLAAWGDEEDAEAIETFVCGFADDPGVALVGVGTEPCGR